MKPNLIKWYKKIRGNFTYSCYAKKNNFNNSEYWKTFNSILKE